MWQQECQITHVKHGYTVSDLLNINSIDVDINIVRTWKEKGLRFNHRHVRREQRCSNNSNTDQESC